MKIIESPVGAEIVLDGRRYLNFGGSSYLGLAGKTEILEAGVAALRASGCGYQFPRDYGIATRPHLEVESQAARFFGTEAALYLSAGYFFGLVVMAAMQEQFGAVFSDEWAHHSLRDAIAACGLRHYSYRHLDAEDLERKLAAHLRARERPLVATDGMFPTFGELAPLGDIARAVAPYGGRLLIDESHAFGVIGDLGRGASEHHSLAPADIVIGGSTGKGLGVLGGIIPASEEDVARFRAAPASRGTSIGQPAAAAMCAKSFQYIREHPQLLVRLRENIAYLKSGMRGMGLDVGDTIAPVATFVLDAKEAMRALQERLLSEGIYVLHSNYIGAGLGGAIRCSVFADHTRGHLDRLLDALRRVL